MMKRILYIAVMMVVCTCLSGCVDDSYRGQYDVFNTEYQDSKIPVVVRIGESVDITAKAGTKGSGTVEKAEDLLGKDFYIYAFSKRNHSYKTLAVNDATSTLLDGSLDDLSSPAGRSASWNNTLQRVEWPDKKDVYWPQHSTEDYMYDFFAYYVDDMQLAADSYHRTDNEVNIDIELSDGRQDIMSSKAVPSDMQLDGIFDSELDKTIYKYYWCYSHKSAQLNLHPEFVFKHHLSKIRFCVAPGVTEGVINRVTIHNLKVETKYKGLFRVACKEGEPGVWFDPKAVKEFDLLNEDGSALNYTIDTRKDATGTQEPVDLGSYLLLAPSSNGYRVNIEMSEIKDFGGPHEDDRSTGVYSTFVYKGNQDSPDPFESGSEYVVTFYIYGREDVRMNIEVKPWEEGGYIIPDTEGIPE